MDRDDNGIQTIDSESDDVEMFFHMPPDSSCRLPSAGYCY